MLKNISILILFLALLQSSVRREVDDKMFILTEGRAAARISGASGVIEVRSFSFFGDAQWCLRGFRQCKFVSFDTIQGFSRFRSVIEVPYALRHPLAGH